MPVGRLQPGNEDFGAIIVLAWPSNHPLPSQGGQIWREFETNTYITLHRLHLMLEAAFNLPEALEYEISVDERTFGPGRHGANSKNRHLIDWVGRHSKRPGEVLYSRAEGTLKIELGERKAVTTNLPRLIQGQGAWPQAGKGSLEAARVRLKAMQPKVGHPSPDNLLVRTLGRDRHQLLFGPRNWAFLADHWLEYAPAFVSERRVELPEGDGFELRSLADVEAVMASLDRACEQAKDGQVQERLNSLAQFMEKLRAFW